MNRILKRPVIVGAVIGAAGLVAVLLALSLSGGSDPTAGATTSGTTTSSSPAAAGATSGRKGGGSRSTVRAAQAWHNLAQCFRSHGYPIADPTVNADGTSSWSSSSAGPSREVGNAASVLGKNTCRAEFEALPPQIVQPPSTQAELHGLVLFARCMRAHGIADFPDPNSDGGFSLNARLQALGKHGAMKQLRACSHFNLGNGIVVAGG
jgi:hypothetical protein